MRQGHASRTAELMALFRALESSRSVDQRLFDDPFARGFLTWRLSVVGILISVPGVERVVSRIIDRRVPGARSSAIARTKLIDDAIEASLEEGTEQLVILGSGFDCRAYRLPSLQRTPVFEVDHPDTQAAKRTILQRLTVLPENVRFVAIDFNRQELESVMTAAGYRRTARTFFLWEGVTNYLTEVGVDTTLRWCARAPRESRVLFTYVHRDVLTRPSAFIGTEKLFASLKKFGENWTFGIEPRELADFLAARGLSLETDLGASQYRERFYGEAAAEMRGYEFYRIAVARVGPGS
jgi:methyltransferase (TIGR00027 family)